MPVAFDSGASADNVGATITISSFVVGSGIDRCLIVGVAIRGDEDVSTIVFNTSESLTVKGTSVLGSSGSSRIRSELWYLVNPTVTTADILITLTGTPTTDARGGVGYFTGANQDTPIPTVVSSSGSGSTTITSTITTTIVDSWVVDNVAGRLDTTYVSDYDERWKNTGSASVAGSSRAATSTGAYSLIWTTGTAPVWASVIVELAEVDSSLEQEGFRFRNDDGSESAATWRQTQDVNDSIAKDINFRLRVLLNSTGDVPTKQYQLEYKETGDSDSEYRKVKT